MVVRFFGPSSSDLPISDLKTTITFLGGYALVQLFVHHFSIVFSIVICTRSVYLQAVHTDVYTQGRVCEGRLLSRSRLRQRAAEGHLAPSYQGKATRHKCEQCGQGCAVSLV